VDPMTTKTKTKPPKVATKRAKAETKPAEAETKPAETETKPAEAETKPAEAETKPPETETKPPETETPPVSAETAAADPAPRTKPPEVDVELSRCPRCGSTSRTGYHSTKCRAITGTLPDGRPYKLVVWKRTQCRDCGLNRIDRFHLKRKPKKSDGELLG
jgi:hypothetical protein